MPPDANADAPPEAPVDAVREELVKLQHSLDTLSQSALDLHNAQIELRASQAIHRDAQSKLASAAEGNKQAKERFDQAVAGVNASLVMG